MNNSFRKNERLRNKKDFTNVYKKGKKYVNKHLVIYSVENNLNNSRIGIAVKKKIGKANKRNRIIRLLKEYFRLNKRHFKSNYDFLFVIRPYFNLYEYKLLKSNLDELFKTIKNLNF